MLSILKTNIKIAFFFWLFFLLLPNWCFALQTENKEQRVDIQARIKIQEKLVQTFSQKEMKIVQELNTVDYALNKARMEIKALSTEKTHLEGKIEQLNLEKENLTKKIMINSKYTAKRLAALYKMNMIGRLDMAGEPASVFDFFLQQNSMKQIITSDFQMLEKQHADLEKLEELEQKLQAQIHSKKTLESHLNNQIRINKKETRKKELILKEIRKKKKLSLAAVESLKLAVLKLDNRIRNMQNSKTSSFNDFSFASFQGRLKSPVKGKIISKFGSSRKGDYKTFTFQNGIDIKVERGEPVKSVFKGDVMFSQWLQGYGNVLIINHGDNYYTLYAHVENIFKQKGEKVSTNEVIATAGDTGSMKGVCLHFEIRHHGKPVNPLKWLAKGA